MIGLILLTVLCVIIISLFIYSFFYFLPQNENEHKQKGCIEVLHSWVCLNYEHRFIIDDKYELINVTRK